MNTYGCTNLISWVQRRSLGTHASGALSTVIHLSPMLLLSTCTQQHMASTNSRRYLQRPYQSCPHTHLDTADQVGIKRALYKHVNVQENMQASHGCNKALAALFPGPLKHTQCGSETDGRYDQGTVFITFMRATNKRPACRHIHRPASPACVLPAVAS
jgi:hypothetical protein